MDNRIMAAIIAAIIIVVSVSAFIVMGDGGNDGNDGGTGDGTSITFVSVTERHSDIDSPVGNKIDDKHLAFTQSGTDAVTYYACDLGFYYTLPNPGEDTDYYGWAFRLDGDSTDTEFHRATVILIRTGSDAPADTVRFADGVYIDSDYASKGADNSTLYVVEETDISFIFSTWDVARSYYVADNDGGNQAREEAHGAYLKLLAPGDYGLTIPEGKTFLGWTGTSGSSEVQYSAGDHVENGYYGSSFYAVWSS